MQIACFELDEAIFSVVLGNFQASLNYEDVAATVRECGKLASQGNYKYFGLANGGVCRAGPDLQSNLYKAPVSKNCSLSVGRRNAIFLYTFGKYILTYMYTQTGKMTSIRL